MNQRMNLKITTVMKSKKKMLKKKMKMKAVKMMKKTQVTSSLMICDLTGLNNKNTLNLWNNRIIYGISSQVETHLIKLKE